jgi:predicted hotdog family 3-hydroxylacyl-ACP dehydratase
MAQACGMLLSTETSLDAGTLGVVAAVRGYEYSSEPFLVGQTLIVTVRPVMLEGELAVCEGELCEQQGGSVLQRARITLVCRKEDS